MAVEKAAEDHADYRFFRFVAATSARFTVAGLFFLVWAVLFAPNRFDTAIFLGSTIVLLVIVSLIAAMTSYMLYKRRGGVIEKTPAS